MKKVTGIMLMALMMAAPMHAQSTDDISTGISKLWKKTKKVVKNTTRSIKEEFNIDNAAADLLEIDGHKYMRIYPVDQYQGEEADEFKKACREEFENKYPNATITKVTIPQDSWIEKATQQNGKVSKYNKYLYCYILAKDGDDGYINARFSLRKIRPVGGKWTKDEDNWPLWERTDVMTPEVCKQLADKQKAETETGK